MTPQTPLLLIDNAFDVVSLYPNAVLTADNETSGHEGYRAIDYRRDRSFYLASADANPNGNSIAVDLGSGNSRGHDFLFIDRGHNLWGQTITLEGGTDGVTWPTSQAFTVPAQGTVGGDPTWPNLSVTEEGALYSIKTGLLTARRRWRLRVNYVAAFLPQITGLMLGQKTQLLGFSSIYDEDAGGRTEAADASAAGYRGAASTYSWRTAEIGLRYIGAAEYDTTMRALRQQLFKLNQPCVLFMDYGTYPERGWMFRYDGSAWGMAKSKAYRDGRIRLRELGASLT
jgi:hypothetical protein